MKSIPRATPLDAPPKAGEQKRIDEWWERLKKKHAGKSRLKKSIKPPIFLNFPKQIKRRKKKLESNNENL